MVSEVDGISCIASAEHNHRHQHEGTAPFSHCKTIKGRQIFTSAQSKNMDALIRLTVRGVSLKGAVSSRFAVVSSRAARRDTMLASGGRVPTASNKSLERCIVMQFAKALR